MYIALNWMHLQKIYHLMQELFLQTTNWCLQNNFLNLIFQGLVCYKSSLKQSNDKLLHMISHMMIKKWIEIFIISGVEAFIKKHNFLEAKNEDPKFLHEEYEKPWDNTLKTQKTKTAIHG